jgi:hypothetical protein
VRLKTLVLLTPVRVPLRDKGRVPIPVLLVLAFKSVWQYYAPSLEVLGLLELFGRMVNESIRIGLANDVSSLRRLSLLSYNQLACYDSPGCYKLCAISRAAGILAARKKSLRRGLPTSPTVSASERPHYIGREATSSLGMQTR